MKVCRQQHRTFIRPPLALEYSRRCDHESCESVLGTAERRVGVVEGVGIIQEVMELVRSSMENSRSIRVLAISGSLRRASSNSALVTASVHVAPDDVHFSLFHGLAELPPFNPDYDSEDTPETVTCFRAELRTCDAVLISSPEYAHGIPGVLKNALDWLVGSGELVDKPIALINA